MNKEELAITYSAYPAPFAPGGGGGGKEDYYDVDRHGNYPLPPPFSLPPQTDEQYPYVPYPNGSPPGPMPTAPDRALTRAGTVTPMAAEDGNAKSDEFYHPPIRPATFQVLLIAGTILTAVAAFCLTGTTLLIFPADWNLKQWSKILMLTTSLVAMVCIVPFISMTRNVRRLAKAYAENNLEPLGHMCAMVIERAPVYIWVVLSVCSGLACFVFSIIEDKDVDYRRGSNHPFRYPWMFSVIFAVLVSGSMLWMTFLFDRTNRWVSTVTEKRRFEDRGDQEKNNAGRYAGEGLGSDGDYDSDNDEYGEGYDSDDVNRLSRITEEEEEEQTAAGKPGKPDEDGGSDGGKPYAGTQYEGRPGPGRPYEVRQHERRPGGRRREEIPDVMANKF